MPTHLPVSTNELYFSWSATDKELKSETVSHLQHLHEFTVFIGHLTPHSACPKLFVSVEVLQRSKPNGVMLSMVNLPNHTFTGQA